MKTRPLLGLFFAGLAFAGTASAQSFFVTGGTTSVSLNADLLSSAANLLITGASGTVTPAAGFGGGAGFATVGFNIEPTTSFAYSEGLAPFSGAITHTGSVTLTVGPGGGTLAGTAIELGNFTIGFDAARAAGSASGFFVQNTIDGGFDNLIVFDITAPSGATTTASEFALTGSSLLVSDQLGGFLFANGVTGSNLTGAAVGLAQVNATASAIPEPSSFAAIAGVAMLGLAATRRRRRESITLAAA